MDTDDIRSFTIITLLALAFVGLTGWRVYLLIQAVACACATGGAL